MYLIKTIFILSSLIITINCYANSQSFETGSYIIEHKGNEKLNDQVLQNSDGIINNSNDQINGNEQSVYLKIREIDAMDDLELVNNISHNDDLLEKHVKHNDTDDTIVESQNFTSTQNASSIKIENLKLTTGFGTIKENSNENLNEIKEDSTYGKDISKVIESYYLSIVLLFPENIQLVLLDVSSTNYLILAMISLILVFLGLSKYDHRKMLSSLKLNEAVLSLELQIQELLFENQTFALKIIDMENELNDKNVDMDSIEESMMRIKEMNECKEKEVFLWNKKYDELLNEYDEKNKIELSLRETLEILQNENKLLLEQNTNLIDTANKSIDLDKYEALEIKVQNLESEFMFRESQIEEYKKKYFEQEAKFDELKNELANKEVSLNVLQNLIAKNSISETDEDKIKNENVLANLMDVASFQNKIEVLEQQVRNLESNMNVSEINKEKLENDLELLRKDLDDKNQKIKEYEIQIKLVNDLRKKDFEINVKAFSDLDAQLKKKSSEAEKSVHLLEQLKFKQERIQELETQIGRIEKNSTQEQQAFEKQAHENWLSARKYEKEAKEARQEAKLWKDKYNEIEQYKENAILRPLSVNKRLSSSYLHLNQTDDSVETSSPFKVVNPESALERPSSTLNSGLMISQPQFLHNSLSPNMSFNPFLMRGLPLPHMYRAPFPGQFMNLAPTFNPVNIPMQISITPKFDRNSTSSPEMYSQDSAPTTQLSSYQMPFNIQTQSTFMQESIENQQKEQQNSPTEQNSSYNV